jgi:hypothetical protein
MKHTIKCAVFGINSNGETDIFFCKVEAEEEQIENGDHYDAAKDEAATCGYDPVIACDENDPAGAVMQLMNWDSVTETVKI